jgi:hypothetical protein
VIEYQKQDVASWGTFTCIDNSFSGTIGPYTFGNMPAMRKISDSAFSSMEGSLGFGELNALEKIGTSAFAGVTGNITFATTGSLEVEVEIGGAPFFGVTGSVAFADLGGIRNLVSDMFLLVQGSVELQRGSLLTIGDRSFGGVLGNVTFGTDGSNVLEQTQTINQFAFMGVAGTVSWTGHLGSLVKIGTSAFQDVVGELNFGICSKLKTIGESAFASLQGSASFRGLSMLEYVNSNAFKGAEGPISLGGMPQSQALFAEGALDVNGDLTIGSCIGDGMLGDMAHVGAFMFYDFSIGNVHIQMDCADFLVFLGCGGIVVAVPGNYKFVNGCPECIAGQNELIDGVLGSLKCPYTSTMTTGSTGTETETSATQTKTKTSTTTGTLVMETVTSSTTSRSVTETTATTTVLKCDSVETCDDHEGQELIGNAANVTCTMLESSAACGWEQCCQTRVAEPTMMTTLSPTQMLAHVSEQVYALVQRGELAAASAVLGRLVDQSAAEEIVQVLLAAATSAEDSAAISLYNEILFFYTPKSSPSTKAPTAATFGSVVFALAPTPPPAREPAPVPTQALGTPPPTSPSPAPATPPSRDEHSPQKEAEGPKKSPKGKSVSPSKHAHAKQPNFKSTKSNKGKGGVKGGISKAIESAAELKRATNTTILVSIAISALLVAFAAVPLQKRMQEWQDRRFEEQYMPIPEEAQERKPQRTTTALTTDGAHNHVGELDHDNSGDDTSDHQYGIPHGQEFRSIASIADFDAFDDFGATDTVDLLADLTLPTTPLDLGGGGQSQASYGTTASSTTSF